MDFAKARSALLRLNVARISMGLKGRWMETIFPSGPDYRDELARFNRLYLVRDPWSLAQRESELFRFVQTNQFIRDNFGHLESLLEIGCGEGIQSSHLKEVCSRLYAVDVSLRAVRRARRLCPRGIFDVGDMYHLPQTIPPQRFDVVTAFEVLYYMADIPRALSRLSELGRACVVSYYDGAREVLDMHVGKMPGVQFAIISCDDVSWTIARWRPSVSV